MSFSSVLTSLAMQFPTLVVCFVGLILVLLQMHRLPRVATLVAAGLALMLLAAVLQPLVQMLVPAVIVPSYNRRPGPMNISLVYMASAGLFNMMRAVALGLLAYAAFIDRPRYSLTNPSARPWPPAPPPVEGKIVSGNTP